jgi:hypothetical protein
MLLVAGHDIGLVHTLVIEGNLAAKLGAATSRPPQPTRLLRVRSS